MTGIRAQVGSKWKLRPLLGAAAVLCTFGGLVSAAEPQLTTAEIRIRDPFIYADVPNKTYFMYAQASNRSGSHFTGVEVYSSPDLIQWTAPRPVMKVSNSADIHAVWAPEMHTYNGQYYLFVTLTYKNKLPIDKPVPDANWPEMHIRGTHIFRAESPLGPFVPLKSGSHTPAEWMALDGTLYVEEDKPYMVFCHEWVQTIDGTIDAVLLTHDLAGTIGPPRTLFKASSAPGAISAPRAGKVTDGCFLYRSPKSNRLFMIWSTFIPGKEYCVVLTHSESGKIAGPWKEQKLIYTKNGGHGMIFRKFDGRLMLALHQPNSGGKERLHLFEVEDDGKSLSIQNEMRP